jgi:predicted lysophospholipase L1 biosynthesis ABC-type transport system permease subunit
LGGCAGEFEGLGANRRGLWQYVAACFGAQAMISGLLAAFGRFARATFLAYGIALLPSFAPKRWFTFVDPVFTWLTAGCGGECGDAGIVRGDVA